MAKRKKSWILGLVLTLMLLFAGTFSYAIIGLGSPENSSRQLDGPNGVDSACEPPGSLCHHPV